MADIREQILVRLLAVAETVTGINAALRNSIGISDSQRPAIVILDADESAEDTDPKSRPVNAPRIVSMTPEIYIMLGGKAETVGTSINTLRARLIKAIIGDATLIALTADDRGIRYGGCATGLAMGRSMEGEMGVSFTFTYYLKPDDL